MKALVTTKVRPRTVEYLRRLKRLLTDNQTISAEKLSKEFNLSQGSIFRMIRLLREVEHVGVYATPKGYVLAEYATRNHDVHFLRRMHGRRTSDYINVQAALPWLQKRWHSVEQKQTLEIALRPLSSSLSALNIANNKLRDAEGK